MTLRHISLRLKCAGLGRKARIHSFPNFNRIWYWSEIPYFLKFVVEHLPKKVFFCLMSHFSMKMGESFKQKSWTKSVDGKDHKFLWVEECLISKPFVWKVVPARLTFSVVTGICEPCVNYCAINSEN